MLHGVYGALLVALVLFTRGTPGFSAENSVEETTVTRPGAGTIRAERPGSSWDDPIENPRDLTGRSVKTPRVRAVHTRNPSLVGGAAYLIMVDPWLGYQRGRELALREFTWTDGAYGEAGRQSGPTLEDQATRMSSRDRTNSCSLCHNVPWRDMGAGATIAMHGGRGRNTPHLFGAGLLEMVAWQNRLFLMGLADENRDGWISLEETRGKKAYVDNLPRDLDGHRRILLGRFDDTDADGLPNLDPTIAIWFVDSNGDRIPWARSLHDPGVAGYNLLHMVFGQGHHLWQGTHGAPTASTLRATAASSFDLHLGLQAVDPGQTEDPDADGLSTVTLAGARQFSFAASRDRGRVQDEAGVSRDDPDRDGVCEEISQGDLDLVEWYLLNHPRPAVRSMNARNRRGRKIFDDTGCTRCHVPDWTLHGADPSAEDYTLRFLGDRRFFDLDVSPRSKAGDAEGEPSNDLVGKLVPLSTQVDGRYIPSKSSFLIEGLYSDLASHDLGEGFLEIQYDGSVVRYHRTAPLWGVGSTAPYGHDGVSLDLDTVIRRHGGEATPVTSRYRTLKSPEREELLDFLRNLVLYGTDEIPCDVDGDGLVQDHFQVAGQDTGTERLNPEWLFRVPGRIEGSVVVTDGRAPQGLKIRSDALRNAEEAYGVQLPYLRDTDADGFPDVRDARPRVAGVEPVAESVQSPGR